jgi:hypothetical protein
MCSIRCRQLMSETVTDRLQSIDDPASDLTRSGA